MKIEYVEEFLSRLGYEWKREYFNSKTLDYVVAEKWEDIRSNFFRLTSLRLYKGKDYGYIDFLINEKHFIQYREEPEIQGSGSQIYMDKDYSNEWQQFQAEKSPSMGD
ncbi:MAG: hypothetical protein ACI4PF_00950 [Christensenellales bacterium]